MGLFDKILWVVLGWIGTLAELVRFLMQYTIGLVWVLYSAVRGQNYKKRFTNINRNAIEELKWIFNEFIYFIKESV